MLIKLLLAFAGGLVPVLVWLWFFEHEDKHPEPRRLVFLAFVAGMIGVVLVVPFEKIVADYFSNTFIIVVLWAAIEEIIKFSVAYIAVLRNKENDEPIDSLMYLIMTALGFAALENALFIAEPIFNGSTASAIATGDFRFVGATLLHLTASGIVGICLAFSFYKSNLSKWLHVGAGLILAVVLHALFNLFIIVLDGGKSIISFYLVWFAVVIVLLFFEKIKQLNKPTI